MWKIPQHGGLIASPGILNTFIWWNKCLLAYIDTFYNFFLLHKADTWRGLIGIKWKELHFYLHAHRSTCLCQTIRIPKGIYRTGPNIQIDVKAGRKTICNLYVYTIILVSPTVQGLFLGNLDIRTTLPNWHKGMVVRLCMFRVSLLLISK